MKIIDIHTHGIGGYDTKTTSEEHILKIAALHSSLGVSEILLTVYPDTIEVMRGNMASVKRAMEIQNAKYRIQDSGLKGSTKSTLQLQDFKPSRIIGVHLEGPFLNPAKCGALNALTFIKPTEYNFRELIEGFEDIVKVITVAPEINGAVGLIRNISKRRIIVSMGHSDATYTEAEAGFKAGAKGITHLFNAMRGVHHREPGIAGFGLLNQTIYVEVIADPYHLHLMTLELIFNIKNPEKIIIISDSVKKTKSGEMRKKTEGIINAHGKLSGGSMTIVESSKRLVKRGFDESVIMKCITENPERYLQTTT